MLRGSAPVQALRAIGLPYSINACNLRRLAPLIFVFAAPTLFGASALAQDIGKIKFVSGPVTVTRGTSSATAIAGSPLQRNDIVHTGSKAGALLVLLDGSELNVGHDTELRVILHNVETQQTTIEMLYGHLRATVTPVTKQGGIFQVHTPTAVAVALGTIVQVDATQASVASTFTAGNVQNLPLNGRDYTQLANLQPGTLTNQPATRPSDFNLSGETNSSGEPTNLTSSAVTPSMEAIEEFNLISGTSSDRLLSIATRSGGNQFHGFLFDEFRNSPVNSILQPQFGLSTVFGSLQLPPGQSTADYNITLHNLNLGLDYRLRPTLSNSVGFRYIQSGTYDLVVQPADGSPARAVNNINVVGGANVNLGNLQLRFGTNPSASTTTLSPQTSFTYSFPSPAGPVLDFRQYDTFIYGGDDWKIGHNLTLNLGLTWSFHDARLGSRLAPDATGAWSNSLNLGNPYSHAPSPFGWQGAEFSHLGKDPKTLLRASFARYADQPPPTGNPANQIGANFIFDANSLQTEPTVQSNATDSAIQSYVPGQPTTLSIPLDRGYVTIDLQAYDPSIHGMRYTWQRFWVNPDGTLSASHVWQGQLYNYSELKTLQYCLNGVVTEASLEKNPSSQVTVSSADPTQTNALTRAPQDALSAVVNFIMKKDFEGFRLDSPYDFTAPTNSLPQANSTNYVVPGRLDFRPGSTSSGSSFMAFPSTNTLRPFSWQSSLNLGGYYSSPNFGMTFAVNPDWRQGLTPDEARYMLPTGPGPFERQFSTQFPNTTPTGKIPVFPSNGTMTSTGNFVFFAPSFSSTNPGESTGNYSSNDSAFGGLFNYGSRIPKPRYEYGVSYSRPRQDIDFGGRGAPTLGTSPSVTYDVKPHLSLSYVSNRLAEKYSFLSESSFTSQFNAPGFQSFTPNFNPWPTLTLLPPVATDIPRNAPSQTQSAGSNSLSLYGYGDSWMVPTSVLPTLDYQWFLHDVYKYCYEPGDWLVGHNAYSDFLAYLDYYGIYNWDKYDVMDWYFEDYPVSREYGTSYWSFPANHFFGDYFNPIPARIISASTGKNTAALISLTQFAPGDKIFSTYKSQTRVTALHHWAVVLGGGVVRYLMPGQFVIIKFGGAPSMPQAVAKAGTTTPTVQQASFSSDATYSDLFSPFTELGPSGPTCTIVAFNGVALDPGQSAAFEYTMLGAGTSTGNAIKLTVTNKSKCTLYFFVDFGTIVVPHSLEHKIGALAGILLGGDLNFNNIKSYQVMINYGGLLVIVVIPADSVPRGRPAGKISGHVSPPELLDDASFEPVVEGNTASMFLRSYCLELHKLAPHPNTRYSFADTEMQQKLGPNATFLARLFAMVQAGTLKLPPGISLDSLVQWTLWASRENMDEKKFMESYTALVHHNYEAQKKKWDKEAQRMVEESGKNLWSVVKIGLNVG